MNSAKHKEVYEKPIVNGSFEKCPYCGCDEFKMIEVAVCKDGFMTVINENGTLLRSSDYKSNDIMVNILYSCENCWNDWVVKHEFFLGRIYEEFVKIVK